MTKGTKTKVTRAVLMIALQGVHQILIRSSDTSEATRASLEGITLDVARPISSTSLRPAIGIEICDCPAEYNSTSCQDPGIGFYRWYKEQHVTSEIIIDLIGSAKKCQCNGRTETCDAETGECLVGRPYLVT